MINVRVSAKTIEAVDICSFELAPQDGETLPGFSPGSHIDVDLPIGLSRQYSLVGGSSNVEDRYLIAVLKQATSRGGSRWMHDVLSVGDVLQINEPQNQFPLVNAASHHVLIAGGIGITPILCMAEHLVSTGESFELHYTARSADRMAFADRLGSPRFRPQTTLYISEGGADQRLDLQSLLGVRRADAHVYVCGPQRLIDSVFDIARTSGWADDQLHREFFSVSAIDQSNDREFEVRLAKSGQVILIPVGTTVVDALADNGIEIMTSCEQGVCGTCLTRVLEGIPDHRDVLLTPQQRALNDQFTPCCSRSKSAVLVLDL